MTSDNHDGFRDDSSDRARTDDPAGSVVVRQQQQQQRRRGPMLFGIVAAATQKYGVIGIDGKLPWRSSSISIPEDRERFVELTRGGILIVGRRTFADEDPTGAHVGHVRACIVVSSTMDAPELEERRGDWGVQGDGGGGPDVRLARSFDEALDVASREFSSSSDDDGDSDVVPPTGGNGSNKYRRDGARCSRDDNNGSIDCWVGGGEGIYREALRHPNASEVHLTHVDVTADLDRYERSRRRGSSTVAYFPLEELESNGFEEASRVKVVGSLCTFCVYKRGTAAMKG